MGRGPAPVRGLPGRGGGPLLEQAAEQAEEFARHGYVLAIVGRRDGLAEALAGYGITALPAVEPESAEQLERFRPAASRQATTAAPSQAIAGRGRPGGARAVPHAEVRCLA